MSEELRHVTPEYQEQLRALARNLVRREIEEQLEVVEAQEAQQVPDVAGRDILERTDLGQLNRWDDMGRY